jgi:hypothetical protein
MKSQIIITIILTCTLILILLRRRQTRRKKIIPTSLSRGIRYDIPYSKKSLFRLSGLNSTEYSLADLVLNQLTHPSLDHVQVLINDELISDSGIGFSSAADMIANPSVVTIYLFGEMDPSVVHAYYIKNDILET